MFIGDSGLSPCCALFVLALDIRMKIANDGLNPNLFNETNIVLRKILSLFDAGVSLESLGLDFYKNLKITLMKETNQCLNSSNKDLIIRLVAQINKIIL